MTRAKHAFVAIILIFTILLFASTALAGKRPNPHRGKSLFKANCKICHVKADPAGFLAPLTKTQAQWERFFKSDRKLGPCLERVAEKTGTSLNESQLRDMSYYLIKHAADSDQPETCGQ